MYQVLVKWFNNEVVNELMNETQVRTLISSTKELVKYAEVITPSGVTKEITHHFNK
jgi:uncharacterized protein YacL (UPF0231 family)